MYDLCMAIDTADLNSDCQSVWAASGASKTAAEILGFCTKFQADATVAQTCSTQADALAIRRELCEVIPTSSLTASCTDYWMANASTEVAADQSSFCSSHKTNAIVALACTLLASQQDMPIIFDLCLNINTCSLNAPCRSFWTENFDSLTSS